MFLFRSLSHSSIWEGVLEQPMLFSGWARHVSQPYLPPSAFFPPVVRPNYFAPKLRLFLLQPAVRRKTCPMCSATAKTGWGAPACLGLIEHRGSPMKLLYGGGSRCGEPTLKRLLKADTVGTFQIE